MAVSLLKFRLGMFLSAISVIILGFLVAYGLLGYLFGFAYTSIIVTGALAFVTFFTIIQWLLGPLMIKAAYRLIEVKADDPTYGWVYNLVQEVATYNNMSMPKVYVAPVNFPNAFAFSSPLFGKNMAITTPLINILNKDEIKAVIGHEIGHLRHRDTEILLAVSLIPTLMYWLGYSLWWGGLLGGGGGGRNGNSGLLFLIGIALIAVSFVFNIFVLFLNRMREAYADVNSALTIPNGASNLQTALAKIVIYTDPGVVDRVKQKSGGVAKMLLFSGTDVSNEEIPSYKAQELVNYWRTQKVGILSDLFSDHPHPAKRIKLLDKFTQAQWSPVA
ncbi:heat shock protein HtpX [Sulfolobus acidocaldarius SUSAZ]|nr:heat shock protein HtpX [Sulfolobus acidocaldarius SUSAZ]